MGDLLSFLSLLRPGHRERSILTCLKHQNALPHHLVLSINPAVAHAGLTKVGAITMECPACKVTVEPDSLFCRRCGHQIANLVQQEDDYARELIARTAKFTQEGLDACYEYCKRFPNGPAVADMNITASIICIQEAYVATQNGQRPHANISLLSCLDQIGSGISPVLKNGLITSCRFSDKQVRGLLLAILPITKDKMAEFLSTLFDEAKTETQALLKDGKTRFEMEKMIWDDIRKEADAYSRALKEDDLETALRGYTHIKQLMPTTPYFRYTVGIVLSRQGKPWEALKEYLYGFYLDASDPHLTVNLMDRLTAHGFHPLALEVLKHHRHYRKVDRGSTSDRDIELFGELARAATTAFVCSFWKKLDATKIPSDGPDLMDDLSPSERPWLKDPSKFLRIPGDILENKRVFISYRRADTADAAQRLLRKINTDHPELVVFLDEAAMVGGEEWSTRLRNEIDKADIVLLLIGQYWQNRAGLARLHKTDDVLRGEIAFAIRHEKPIIPILIGSAKMPQLNQLPEEIQAIVGYHAERLQNENFDADWTRIVQSIKKTLTQKVIETAQAFQTLHEIADIKDPDARAKALIEGLDKSGLRRYIPQQSINGEGVPYNEIVEDGVWECNAVGPGQTFSLRLVIGRLPRNLFTGELRMHDWEGKILETHKLRGDCYPVSDPKAKLQLGWKLKYIQDETTDGELFIPFYEKIGDAIVGSDSNGVQFTSRNVEPRQI